MENFIYFNFLQNHLHNNEHPKQDQTMIKTLISIKFKKKQLISLLRETNSVSISILQQDTKRAQAVWLRCNSVMLIVLTELHCAQLEYSKKIHNKCSLT